MKTRAPYLLSRRALTEIAPSHALSSPDDMQPPKGMRAAYLASLLDESHRPALHLLDHADGFDFGTHHRWERGEMVYTVAGLRWIADRFDEMVSAPAALIVRSAANDLEQSIARALRAEEVATPKKIPVPRGTVELTPEGRAWLNRWENARQ